MKSIIDAFFIVAMLACVIIIQQADRRNLQTQIDELRLLFNQKFMQEVMVNKPVVRFEF